VNLTARIAPDLLPGWCVGPLDVGPTILTGNELWFVHLPVGQHLVYHRRYAIESADCKPALQFGYQFFTRYLAARHSISLLKALSCIDHTDLTQSFELQARHLLSSTIKNYPQFD
jgi:hypothetical protein